MATSVGLKEEDQKLLELLSSYIKCAENFIQICKDLVHVKGARKLERMCQAELKFLLSLKRKFPSMQESQLKSSNLSHFAGILHSARCVSDVSSLLKPFVCPGRPENLVVDVVTAQGQVWIKVIARKAQALHLIWGGKGQFGERDLVRQAEDYLLCASRHPVNFATPQVHFVFYNQVTHEMAETLEALGVIVWGDRVDIEKDVLEKIQNIDALWEEEEEEEENSEISSDDDLEFEGEENTGNKICSETNKTVFDDSNDVMEQNNVRATGNVSHSAHAKMEESNVTTDVPNSRSEVHIDSSENRKSEGERNLLDIFPDHSFISTIVTSFPDLHNIGQNFHVRPKVNLDISTLINLVSSVTHGGNNFVFKDDVLTQQAADERKNPALPGLLQFLEGKELLVCQTALKDFQTILDMLGGPNEKKRAEELMRKVQIVSDQPSERTQKLPETAKIKSQSKIVFGTGDQLKAITATSNSGFIRAAEHKGVSFAVHLHPPRSLTEQKETFATKISDTESTTDDGKKLIHP